MKSIYSILPLFLAASLGAQPARGVKLDLAPGSEVAFDGTSNVHGFSCRTSDIEAEIDVDPAYRTADLGEMKRPILNVRVTIPVKSLRCGNKQLENNMFKTLKADEFPAIRYALTTYEVVPAGSPDSFVAKATGTLTIAGKDQPIEMDIRAARAASGSAKAEGRRELLMTDFGIKPPTFMLGALRTGNKITVKFDLKASPATTAALYELGNAFAINK